MNGEIWESLLENLILVLGEPLYEIICRVRPRMCPLEHYTSLALNFARNLNLTQTFSVGFYNPPR